MTLSAYTAYQNLLESVASCSVPADQILRLEVACPATLPSQWLLHQQNCSRYLWANRERNYEMAGIGESDVVQPHNEQGMREAIDQISSRIIGCSDNLRYYGGCRFSENASTKGRWRGFKAYRFVLPLLEICRDAERCFFACNINGKADKTEVLNTLKSVTFEEEYARPQFPRFIERANQPTHSAWEALVNDALAAIDAGEFQKVVLARQTTFNLTGKADPVALIQRMGSVANNVYLFCFEPMPGRAFIGASPERLYKRSNNRIYSEALAGTRPRGLSLTTDDRYENDLLHSEKDHREHQIVLEEVCSILRRFCSHIESASIPQIVKLSGCQHLQSAISGILNEDSNDGMLLEALHPTPAVGGFPEAEAMRWIAQKESFDRGIYAAPVGWIGADEAEFCVGIRSGLLLENTLTLFSGAGIVTGSKPEDEWRELDAKLEGFLKIMRQGT